VVDASGLVDYIGGRTPSGPAKLSAIGRSLPHTCWLQLCRGASTVRSSNYDDAVLAVEPLANQNPDSASCHADWSSSMICTGNRDRFVFEPSVALSHSMSKRGTYVRALASAYAGMGDYTNLLSKYYADAVRLLPANADAQHGLGWVLRVSGSAGMRKLLYERRIALGLDTPAKHKELQSHYLRLEHGPRRSRIQDRYPGGPRHPDQHHWLGVTFAQQERLSRRSEYREGYRGSTGQL